MGLEMHTLRRERSGHFWWRAAEPIPARPEALAPIADEPHEAPAAAVIRSNAAGASAQAPAPTIKPTVDALGAVRPAGASGTRAGTFDAPTLSSSKPGRRSATRSASSHRVAASRGRGGRACVALLLRRNALLAASVVGALLFAGATGFGRHVRPSQSLSGGLEQVLVGAGFGINEIALSGHRHTLDQDIFRALGASGSSLLLLDVSAARKRVEALPWVESASLVRVLPDKLKVDVRERVAAAAWLDGDRVALVDATGRVLAYVATFVPPELPRIGGAGAPEAAAELISALERHPALRARLDIAHRIGWRRWDLELNGGTRVMLAAGPSLVSLDRLVELDRETQVLEQRGQVVDLTMSRSIAVSEPAPSAAPGAPAGHPLPHHRPARRL